MRADSDPARQVLFANLRQSHVSVRLAYGVHEWLGGTWASALLVSCYGLASFLCIAPPRNPRARLFVVAKHANARRQVARVVAWVGPDECSWLRTGVKAILALSTLRALTLLLAPRSLFRTVRIIRTIDARHGFLVSCRAAAAIAWYVRTREILGAPTPAAVLVSSDSHPEELGFVAAARALNIPHVFISHAYPTPISPPLDFSLSILEGEAAVQARRRKGPIKGDVYLAGVEGESAPMDAARFVRPNPVIGLFPPKALSWQTLREIVDDCRRHYNARQIVIRWHPSMFEAPHLSRVLGDASGVVESSRQAQLPDVARLCDWIIADENSNVHLPVLKLGIPTVAVKGLGLYPESRADQYGFVASRIILPPVKSIRDVRADTLMAFFAEGWRNRFDRYDASYLRDSTIIGNEVRTAIQDLFDDALPKTVECAR
jgi:hypothetical protein